MTPGSLLMGPMLGMFLLGMLSDKATSAGAFWGCLISVIASLVAVFASPLEMFWLTLLGTSLTVIPGCAIALLRRASAHEMQLNRTLTLASFRESRNGLEQETKAQTC